MRPICLLRDAVAQRARCDLALAVRSARAARRRRPRGRRAAARAAAEAADLARGDVVRALQAAGGQRVGGRLQLAQRLVARAGARKHLARARPRQPDVHVTADGGDAQAVARRPSTHGRVVAPRRAARAPRRSAASRRAASGSARWSRAAPARSAQAAAASCADLQRADDERLGELAGLRWVNPLNRGPAAATAMRMQPRRVDVERHEQRRVEAADPGRGRSGCWRATIRSASAPARARPRRGSPASDVQVAGDGERVAEQRLGSQQARQLDRLRDRLSRAPSMSPRFQRLMPR